MGYCFMSIEKVKTTSGFSGKYEHNYRTRDVANADKEKQEENEELVSLDGKTYVSVFRKKIAALPYYETHQVRKNAVKGIEVMLTFSLSEKDRLDLDKWKADNVEWLRSSFNASPEAIEKYGDNVISVMYHADESTVHCHAMVIPVDDKGHLNFSYYVDGKESLFALQDSYGELMEKNHGLSRGEYRSVAKHETIKRFYTELNNAANYVPPRIAEGQSFEDYYQKITKEIQDMRIAHLQEVKQLTRERDEARSIAKPSLDATIKAKENEKLLKKYKDEFDGLEHEYGSMHNVRTMLRTTKRLNEALQTYPDESMRNETLNRINTLLEWQGSSSAKDKDKKKHLEKEETQISE